MRVTIPTVVCLVVVLCSSTTAQAQIADEFPMDVRSLAMGQAGTAVAEGPAAVWWNPGALAVADGIGFSMGGRKLHPDFDLWIGNAAASFGANGFGVGANFTYLSLGDVGAIFRNDFQPFEYVLRLGAAIDVLRFSPDTNENIKLGLGGTLNITHGNSFPTREIVRSNDETATAVDFDLAALLQVRYPVDAVSENDYVGGRFGIRFDNVSDQGIAYEGQQEETPLGQSVHVGVALEGGLRETQLWQHLLHGVITFDTQVFLGERSDRSSIYKFGFEFSPGFQQANNTSFLAMRAGYIKDEDGGVSDVTIGGALGNTYRAESRDYSVLLEYANLPPISGSDRVHHVSFGVKIGL